MRIGFVGLLALALFLDPWNSFMLFGFPSSIVVRILALGLAFPVILMEYKKIHQTSWVILLPFLFLAWIFLRGFHAPIVMESLRSLRYYSIGILTFLAIAFLNPSTREVKFIVWSQVLGCLLGIAMMQYGAISLDSGIRASVDGINGNYTAYCCVHAASLLVILWRHQVARMGLIRLNYIVLIITLSFLTYGAILPATRGAFLGMGLIFTLMIFRLPTKHRWYKFALLFVLVIIVVESLNLFPSLLVRSLGDNTQDYGSYRLLLWGKAWQLFQGAPLIGIGPGQFGPSAFGVPVHNVFLAVLTELGIIGFCLFMAFILSVFFQVRKNYGIYNAWIFFGPWLFIALTGAWESAYAAYASFGLLFVRPEAPPISSFHENIG